MQGNSAGERSLSQAEQGGSVATSVTQTKPEKGAQMRLTCCREAPVRLRLWSRQGGFGSLNNAFCGLEAAILLSVVARGSLELIQKLVVEEAC